MGIGLNLKRILDERKITIKELSEKTAIPLNTLYSITKRDNQNMRVDYLQKIAAVLEVSVDYLLGWRVNTYIIPPELLKEKGKGMTSEERKKLNEYARKVFGDMFESHDEKLNAFLDSFNELTYPQYLTFLEEVTALIPEEKLLLINYAKFLKSQRGDAE